MIRGLTFFADGERYAVDVTLVQKVARKMEVTPVAAAPCEVLGIANLKGKAVVLLSLAALLRRKRDRAECRLAERGMQTVSAVIFKSPEGDGDPMGLVIDGPGDLVEIDESKTAPPPLTEETAESQGFFSTSTSTPTPVPSLISGVYESGGTLYRILNIDSIVSRFRSGGSELKL